MPDAPLRDLTPEEIASYDRDGAVCVRGLFADAWVERMAGAIDQVTENPTEYGRQVSLKDEGFSGDLFVWKSHDEFRDFVYDSPAAHIAAQVLRSKRVNFFYDQLFVKPAGCHVATPWHQDITFWPIEGERICSIWITFDPIDRDSSGLEFVRGSNRWSRRFKAVTPDYNAYMLDSDLEDPPDVDAHREDYDLTCWDMEPGDAILFDSVVLHGSTGNHTTDRPRRAFASRWCGEGVRYAPRHATMPLMWQHGLEPGDSIGGSLFPQILPETIPAESEVRSRGPEAPDPEHVQRAIANMVEVLKRREAEGAAAPRR